MTTILQPSSIFDTAEHSSPFEIWHDRLANTYDVTLHLEDVDPFRVHFRGWSLGSVVVTGGEFTAQTFRRDAALIRKDQLDQYGLFAQGYGERISNAGGQERLIRPGDLQFFDMAQEETSIATAGSSGTLFLPRPLVEEALPAAAGYHGTVLRDGAARILASYILNMGQHLEQAPVASVPAIAGASVDLALGCLTAVLTDDQDRACAAYYMTLRRRIERYIDAHLGMPGLGVDVIRAEFGLSRSALYRVFAAHRGVGRYIKLRRLTKIRTILMENRDTRTLAELAADFGFHSSGHFSREFHRQFGCTPRDVRTHGVLSIQSEASDNLVGFARLLHTIRA